MEFRMTTDLSTALKPQEITFNYEELKTALAEKLEKYKGLLVTEDGIAEAKKDRAMLRKVRDALNAEKVSVKKQWLPQRENRRYSKATSSYRQSLSKINFAVGGILCIVTIQKQ